MKKNRINLLMQILGLTVFCILAAASSSSQSATKSSDIDWRGAAVGAGAGYNGYIIIGTASSESSASELAASKGYDYYLWDSVNGKVYAK